ncbi:MAG TPA: MotA/TolQ/ExbB proton channel family protein [Burkholderiales bacterium]|nr:MotA/TolQ/ExbB proton channel family protein [Burkholderiales bacterium]
MDTASSVGVLGFWAQSDTVGRSAALLLLAMSLASWYLILWKGWRTWYTRRYAERAMGAFWEGEDLTEAVAHMQLSAPDSPFSETAAEGANAAAHHARHAGGKIAATLTLSEFVTRAIRRAITRTTARFESGLAVLASIGATAPFVGLFGTVWGIYHALIGIGFTGEATIDKVAGPVGEALIMTAFGIAVAVPAVLGYNFLTRVNRVILAELDAFAHDLHAYLTTGAKLTMTHDKSSVASMRSRS